MQALSHVCLPLPDFFDQVMHFCKGDYTTFMDVKGKLIDIFSSTIAYWYTFDNACPKQMPLNGSHKPKLLSNTIEVKALAHVYKLDPSFLTNARFFSIKENLSNSSYNLGAIATPFVFKTSSKPMVTCFASQSLEIKFTTTIKTSLAPFDIHKSKVQVVDIQSVNVSCT